MTTVHWTAVAVTAVAILSGCNKPTSPSATNASAGSQSEADRGVTSANPLRYEIRGWVLLDGQPLTESTMHFHPVDGEGERVKVTATKDGTFTGKLPAGEYKVTITKTVAGKHPTDWSANLVPARYSDPITSDLSVEVGDWKNEFKFDLRQ